jgi:hypothetical protein
MTYLESENVRWRRLFWYIAVLLAAAYVYSQIPWSDFWTWIEENWPSLKVFWLGWSLSAIFHVVLTVFVLGLLRAASVPPPRPSNINRFKSRVDRVAYGGKEEER